ncbi:di-heme enzyme [Paucibacter sp. PLA-PC-4]|uniref:methanobactin export MATE transporter MbnM n=1 Tax=Paucibacter sp. PLA-PC-4 TaxID=2993655 RepID=UPI002248E632|nr:methanobactin export MATE transporter MbnM [Paucibacter sp. PLA-PC-4]MCX2862198.1 di-heme enzyme [Paucibacter sp. PLA-PC-4]
MSAAALWNRVALPALVLALAACGGGGTSVQDNQPVNAGWDWRLPANFPTPKVPDDNPMSDAKVELGRFLFYDTRLSGNGRQSCASCHHQDKAFTDGLGRALGSTGQQHPRGAQHLGNVVYNATLTWANPSLVTLERQMETPLFGDDPVEMGVNDANKAEVLARISGDADYRSRFASAFPGEANALQWPQIIKAIAAFQRTLISGSSRYDQYLQGKVLLSAAEDRGMKLFFGEKAECFHCHGSFNFNDQILHAASRLVETPFHNTGLYNIDGKGGFPEPNQGVFELTAKAEDMGAFRAPSLRNVEVTGPYMHDGSVTSLEQVLRFYAAGGRQISSGPYAGDGRANPYKSDLIARIELSEQEQADIIQFLKTLTDHDFLQNPRHADPFKTR